MKTRLICISLVFGLTLLGLSVYAQPNISYSPSTEVYTLNTPIAGPVLSNSGGAVAAFAYGPGVQPAGGAFNNPWGMGVDPSGNVYTINYSNNTVSKYSSATGTFVSNNFFTGGALSNPAGIAFDNAGNAYILSYNRTNNGNGNHKGNAYLEEYNSSGVYQSTIVQGLGDATGIAIDLNNNIYIAEGSYNNGNQTVAQYNTAGQLGFMLSSANITNPMGVGVDGAGNIYVLDGTYNDVTKFSSTGAYISTVITSAQLGTNGNELGIYVDGAGNIYIGNSGTGGAVGNTSGSVTVYNSSGTLLVSKAGLNDPEGIVTDNKGNMYVSDYTNNTVTRYPPVGGYYLSGLLPAGLSFNSATGAFSGTPTTTFNPTTYTVTAYNANGSSTSNVITLSCPDTSTPTISYNPAINVFTINSAITNLTPVTTHSPTSYTISATLPTGLAFSTSTGVISGTPTVISAATVYTITCTNAAGFSGSTTVSIACVIDDFWTGTGSTNDWNNAGNWSVGVPGPTDLASIGVIAYGKHGVEPSIAANEAVTVYFLTFGATHAATLTVQNGASLTINKILTINTNATPTLTAPAAGTGVIKIVPAAVVNVEGTGALTISSPLTVTLQSDVTGSAQISQMTTGSITGTVSVQRYISAIRSYRLLSSPVSTSAVSGVISVNYLKNSCYVTGTTGAAGGFDVGAVNNPSLYLFRENLVGTNASFTSGNYRGVNNLKTAPLYGIDVDGAGFSIYEGNGYLFFFRGDRNIGLTLAQEGSSYIPTATTLTATGSLNQGQITVKNWFTGSTSLLETNISGSPSTDGFNLVGNPYASSINWDTYSTSLNTSGIYAPGVAPFLYILMPNGNYNIYQASSSGGLSTGGIANSNVISSGQGFFVQATGANPSLTFNESAKTVAQVTSGSSGNLFLGAPPQAVVSQYLHILLAQDSVNHDGILINFNSSSNSKYVPNEDALYKTGTGPASMNSLSADNIALSINTMPLPKSSVATIIPLNVSANADGIYQLNMAAIKSIPDLYDVWLMDTYKKDSIDFKHNPTYSFNITRSNAASFGANRFSLVVRQNPALGVHLLNFTAAKTTGGAGVVWKTENEQNYTNFTVERSTDGGATFNVLGGVASSALGTYSFLDNNPVTTTTDEYRLKIEDLNGAITYSKVVTLMYANPNNQTVTSNISVYPNPTSGKVNLAINQTTGTPSFSIMIMNNLGAMVKTATSTQPSWQADVSQLVPGTYFIQVMNKNDNTLVGKSTFVKL